MLNIERFQQLGYTIEQYDYQFIVFKKDNKKITFDLFAKRYCYNSKELFYDQNVEDAVLNLCEQLNFK